MKNFKKMMMLMVLCLLVVIIILGYVMMFFDILELLKNGIGVIDNNGVIYVGLGIVGIFWYKIDFKK